MHSKQDWVNWKRYWHMRVQVLRDLEKQKLKKEDWFNQPSEHPYYNRKVVS